MTPVTETGTTADLRTAIEEPDRCGDILRHMAGSQLQPDRLALEVVDLDAIARQHGGSVDKYQGDKLMAVFGYPVPLENPARAAAGAALGAAGDGVMAGGAGDGACAKAAEPVTARSSPPSMSADFFIVALL